VDDAEAYALKGGRKALAALQNRIKDVETELDAEQRRHAETLKNYRKMDRRLKELTFQARIWLFLLILCSSSARKYRFVLRSSRLNIFLIFS